MAYFELTVDVDPQWTAKTRLRVYAGSENAQSLASSSPAGGKLVRQVAAFDDPAETQTVIGFNLRVSDKCAVIPYGVVAVDEAGNESPIFETFDRVKDVPEGVDASAPQSTGTSGEAMIDWPASEDV